MTKAFIAGTRMTPFDSFPDRIGRNLFTEAGLAALHDAGLGSADIDEVFYGNFLEALSEKQGHQGLLAADILGTTVSSRRVESAWTPSGLAVREAVRAIQSGCVDVVVAGGTERMNNIATADFFEVRAGVISRRRTR